MKAIVEKDDSGKIMIPPEASGPSKPHTRFEVEQDGSALRLVPVGESATEMVEHLQAEAKKLWAEASPEERVRTFREWLDMPRPKAPPLPDEAMHRESMYD